MEIEPLDNYFDLRTFPPQWTDLVDPDLEVVIGRGRALLRAVDLMELAGLVQRLSDGARRKP